MHDSHLEHVLQGAGYLKNVCPDFNLRDELV